MSDNKHTFANNEENSLADSKHISSNFNITSICNCPISESLHEVTECNLIYYLFAFEQQQRELKINPTERYNGRWEVHQKARKWRGKQILHNSNLKTGKKIQGTPLQIRWDLSSKRTSRSNKLCPKNSKSSTYPKTCSIQITHKIAWVIQIVYKLKKTH